MATFRSGIKIFGELTLRQSIGRIRSFSEDRKPGSWSPEDQWAVRPPCSTCPDPCARKKPAKPSRSWLSICKDPEPPIPCDIRHNNCPPPQKTEEPWYAFMTKKKPEKAKPPLNACRMELQRRAEEPDEDYCEDIQDNTWPGSCEEVPEPEEPVCPERPPAPVIRLSCPPPKDLDLMLWCGKPGLTVTRIASQCQSDRMPYEEFRPRKCWKPPPFSLPTKCESPPHQPFCCNVGRLPFAEYKQVDIPKPLYTRYKSVELEDENFLLCMTDARCPAQEPKTSLAMQPPPLQRARPPPETPKQEPCPEKPVLVAASQKPVKLKCAPKFQFRPKPTKLVEKRHYRNPCAQHCACNLKNLNPPEPDRASASDWSNPCCEDAPKVITGTLTDEPPMYQPSPPSRRPPHWMYMLSKPGSRDTPLVPHLENTPQEPDWCGETDGLRFYDGQDEGIYPKPPPDPCSKRVANTPEAEPERAAPCPAPPPVEKEPEAPPCRERFVLMPERFNIRNMRPPEEPSSKSMQEASFQEFIDAKTSNLRSCSKLYPQMKENILYDLVRNCPLPPFDPSKVDPPPRKPPPPECPQPTRFYYRRYSTYSPLHLRKPNYARVLNRMMSEDSRDKCKTRKLVPKARDCPPPQKGPSCNEMELPCCPKAKIPPRCDVRRPLPPCKKRLAPKPSYSECSKDPPPCPRITECNAWEKRELENQKKSKGRKFSNWAAEQGEASGGAARKADGPGGGARSEEGATAPGPRYSDSSELKERGRSLDKSRWSPRRHRKVFPGQELMLNFVNPAEETETSYYKSDSLVRRRKPQWRKLKSAREEEKNVDGTRAEAKKFDVGSSRAGREQLHERKVIAALLRDRRPGGGGGRAGSDGEVTALAVCRPADDSHVGLGSFAAWINGLIRAQRKRSTSCPPSPSKMTQLPSYVETADVNRMMKLTKPYGSKLKSHSMDSLTYFPIAADVGCHDVKKRTSPFRRLWGRNRNRGLTVFPKMKRERARSSMWKYETLSPALDFGREAKVGQARLMGSTPARVSNGDHAWTHRKGLVPGLNLRKQEESSAPTTKTPTGRNLLLNIYQSVHDGHPASKPRSSLIRNPPVERPQKDAPVSAAAKDAHPVGKRSTSKFSIASRGASTFAITAAAARRWKALSHHKCSGTSAAAAEFIGKRSNPGRGKPKRREAPVLVAPKPGNVRFRQSATNCLVTSAMERKESEVLKIAFRGNGDGRPAAPEKATALALSLPQKPWIYIDKGHDAKYDFKKSIAHATVIKSKPKKWLQEVDDLPSDPREFMYEGKKGTKKGTEGPLKDDLKYCADKYLKRQEVKNMLSKLELKKSVLRVAENAVRARQKEQSKKDVISMLDHHCCASSDRSGGRFGWQHALFRNNARPAQGKGIVEIDDPIEESNLSGIKSLMDMRAHPVGPRSASRSVSDTDVPKKVTNNVELYDADLDVVECINVDDKPSNLRVDNLKKQPKQSGAVGRSKWCRVQKDSRAKEDKFIGSFTYEKISDLSAESREVRPMTTAIGRPDVGVSHSLQAVAHTRRYSTDSRDCFTESKPGKEKSRCRGREKREESGKSGDADCECGPKKEVLCEEEEGGGKKEKKKTSKSSDDISSRWNTVRIPGPNCPDG